MTYYKKSDPYKYISIGFALFAFLFLLRVFFAGTFSTLVSTIAYPFWNLRDTVLSNEKDSIDSVESKSSLLADKKSLENQLYALEITNAELTAQSSALSSTTLAELFPLKPHMVLAKVINKPPFSPFDILTIDAGTASGIAIGDIAYVGDNTSIGAITSVTNQQSQITLFSSGGQTKPTDVLRTQEGISLTGDGDGTYEASLPKDFDIEVGDQLVDLSVRQSIIAVVYYIDSSSQSSFKKVLAHIPFNILQSEWVTVQTAQ